MLDRTKLLKEVQQRSAELFVDRGAEFLLAKDLWQKVSADSLLRYKIKAATTAYAIPEWIEPLSTAIPIDPTLTDYGVGSVDGSQIYPDRHQGVACYLINIGSVFINYGARNNVFLKSVPYFFTQEDEDERITPDGINCRRDGYEFAQGLALSLEKQPEISGLYALLFDGSLIFWSLEQKDGEFKQLMLQNYFSSLMNLYQQRIFTASYTSMPKTKEVSNILRLALCNYNTLACDQLSSLEHVHDAICMQFVLKPFTRSALFKHTGSIASLYPDEIQPHFFYLHVGNEIARIEIPDWIAQNESLVNDVSRIIINQCIKGNGYPVVLAEAHEQAVIKGPDREFFYQIINKIGVDKKQRLVVSQKSLKKRGIGI